jgi:hypothetical protein
MSRPQVGVEDPGVVLYLSGAAREDRGALVEHDDRVAEPHHEGHVVLDDEERDAIRVALTDMTFHRLDHDRVDPGGRFVEQDQPGRAHQDGSELEELALTVREF